MHLVAGKASGVTRWAFYGRVSTPDSTQRTNAYQFHIALWDCRRCFPYLPKVKGHAECMGWSRARDRHSLPLQLAALAASGVGVQGM